MTIDIALVLIILGGALVLFVTEKVRMDVTALIVLGALVVTGLVAPQDAVAGFSNGAVVAVWAMFILSDGLTRTGIANVIGATVLRFSGTSLGTMTVVIMLTGGVLSAIHEQHRRGGVDVAGGHRDHPANRDSGLGNCSCRWPTAACWAD